MRFFILTVALAAGVFANFEGGDLHHLLSRDTGLLHEPEGVHEAEHGEWNRELLSHSPHYTKRVRDSTGHEYDLTYYDTGDANITHGDIALPMEFTEHLQSHADHETAGIHMLGVVSTNTRGRWPCPVPYSNRLSLQPSRVQSAIDHLQKYTRWRFVQRTNERDYMEFVDASGCSSYIGKIGGRQAINLANGCGVAATVHEIMHALGIYHEQSRPDRDRFVRINTQNIQRGTENNFQICRGCTAVGNYDFMSVMHYSGTAFSVNRQPTIEPIGGRLPAGVCAMGQRRGLSYGDVFSCMAVFDGSNQCGRDKNPPRYDFDVCQGTGIRSSLPGGTTQRPGTTTQRTTSRSTTTRPIQTTRPGGTNPPVTGGQCSVRARTAHQGFPYTGAISQVTNLPNANGCCDRCNQEQQCASWTFLVQRGTSYCLLYRTPLNGQAYTNVAGYTSGSRGSQADGADEGADGGSDTPYIVGGVVGASAVVIGGAVAYNRKKNKIGKKSTPRAGYSSSQNDVEKDVQDAMRLHDSNRVAGATIPSSV